MGVYPRLYSSGLQCNYNHRHHTYWRFDFDIDGADQDLVLEYNSNTPDLGYGCMEVDLRGSSEDRQRNKVYSGTNLIQIKGSSDRLARYIQLH